MSKDDIIRKLTSRKLWLAIAGLIIAVCAMFGANAELIDKIVGLAMAFASVVGYILGEGLVDAANKPPDSGEADEWSVAPADYYLNNEGKTGTSGLFHGTKGAENDE